MEGRSKRPTENFGHTNYYPFVDRASPYGDFGLDRNYYKRFCFPRGNDLIMNSSNPRTQAFIQWVEQSQPEDVIQEFHRQLRQNSSSPLSAILEDAKAKSPSVSIRDKAILADGEHYCNS